MHTTPVANRLHIGIFGKRNVGKSSFINRLTGQHIAIVSDTPGTTTDPVGKTMEIHGIGPVYLYDTAGIDDSGELGKQRVARTHQILKKINLALLVTTADSFDSTDTNLIEELRSQQREVILIINKTDIIQPDDTLRATVSSQNIPQVCVSCRTGEGIDAAKKIIIERSQRLWVEQDSLLGDIITQGDVVLLVVPIDLGAPKGRLILPQVQVIRDILDHNAVAVTVKEHELSSVLRFFTRPPSLAVCDSQVVKTVADTVPPEINLTTFSILLSQQKGELATFVKNVQHISRLSDGDRVLILEACTHHPMPDDIGRVKLPRWIRQFTGKDVQFEINAGPFLDKNLSRYQLIISCGGCMINRQEMLSRIRAAENVKVPITNYGIAISYVHGILRRVLSPFPAVQAILAENTCGCRVP